MPETALIFICTGQDYWQYIAPAITGAKRFFAADILLFTDSSTKFDVARQVQISHQGWPSVTLMRYHTILKEWQWLLQYKHAFYLDIDSEVTGEVGEEILSDGATACAHVAFVGNPGTPEEDPRSAACLSKKEIKTYYTGMFVGGATWPFLLMCHAITLQVDKDNKKQFIATWHDESHLNRYLHDYPPAKTLGRVHNSYQRGPDVKIFRVDKGTPNRPAVDGKQPGQPANGNQPTGRRTLIAVVTCEKNLTRVKSQQQSWVANAHKFGFDVEFFDGKRLGVPDDYLSLPYKSRAICKWAYDNGYYKMLKVDDDTWLDPSTLVTPDKDYAGLVMSPRDCGHPPANIPDDHPGTWPHEYATGGGCWLGRRAMEIVATADIQPHVWNEDRWVGHVLAEKGIKPARLDYDFYPYLVQRPRRVPLVMQVPTPEAMRGLPGKYAARGYGRR